MKNLLKMSLSIGTLAVAAGVSMNATAIPADWSCVGNCGTNTTADGDVPLAPGFDEYYWVSTVGGVGNGGDLPVAGDLTGQETDGSAAKTPTFFAEAGSTLNFYFNYITSDGAEYTEYAWAALFSNDIFNSYLFTARTTTSGDTVPGFGLPGLGAGVTLNPSSTAIIANATNFSPLGGSSGDCYDTGCGSTGWIEMSYEILADGNYSLGFGVTNALDTNYDTAFAFAGVTIDGIEIDDIPETVSASTPGSLALLGLGLLALGFRRRTQQN